MIESFVLNGHPIECYDARLIGFMVWCTMTMTSAVIFGAFWLAIDLADRYWPHGKPK